VLLTDTRTGIAKDITLAAQQQRHFSYSVAEDKLGTTTTSSLYRFSEASYKPFKSQGSRNNFCQCNQVYFTLSWWVPKVEPI